MAPDTWFSNILIPDILIDGKRSEAFWMILPIGIVSVVFLERNQNAAIDNLSNGLLFHCLCQISSNGFAQMNCDKEKKERKKCMITLFFMIVGVVFIGSVALIRISLVLRSSTGPDRGCDRYTRCAGRTGRCLPRDPRHRTDIR